MEIKEILQTLIDNRRSAEEKLRIKREEIGYADKPTESRYISSTRWDLENAIVMCEIELARIDSNIKELKRIGNKPPKNNKMVGVGNRVTVEIDGKTREFIVTVDAEDIKLGLLPKSSVIGKRIMGRNTNEEIEYETESGKQKLRIIGIF